MIIIQQRMDLEDGCVKSVKAALKNASIHIKKVNLKLMILIWGSMIYKKLLAKFINWKEKRVFKKMARFMAKNNITYKRGDTGK